MKCTIDIDAFIQCLDCLDMIKVNGNLYVSLDLVKEFISRFPKDKLDQESFNIRSSCNENEKY